MRFTELALPGLYLVESEPVSDERGFFARTWCHDEFQARGLSTDIAQCSVSFNLRKGTLRGMHYQAAPHAEIKVIRCNRGAFFDVLVDLRPESPTYAQWTAQELSARNGRMLYVPAGLAHGFQTLEDETEVYYQISERYAPDCARGVRWNDPAFGIEWPDVEVRILSERDRQYPDFHG